MIDFRNFLIAGTSKFYPFETDILDALIAGLDNDCADTLRQQLASINKIQRIDDGKEVNLYRIRHGKPAFDDALCLPNMADEELIASMTLGNKDNNEMKVEVWMVKGRLFSLEFDIPPKQFFSDINLKSARAEICDIQIGLDAMQRQ